jgi:hypothetical protein
MKNIFERASKEKIRFATGKGYLATEDLWDLSLPSLDKVARNVHTDLKNAEEVSFIKTASTASTELNLKMDVIKHIIDYKLNLLDAAKERALKTEKLAELKDLLHDKTKEEMKGLSKEEIAKQIAELEA